MLFSATWAVYNAGAEIIKPADTRRSSLIASTDALNFVTVNDLIQAKFVSPKAQPPTETGLYPGSAYYFWVGNGKQPSPAKNLVMVSKVSVPKTANNLFAYGASQKDFAIDGGIGKEANLGGARTVVNFLKLGMYVVVMGPSEKETEALAGIIASKIN